MFYMLSCFNVAEGSTIADFQAGLEAFTRELLDLGLVSEVGKVGARRSDTILDTDEERDHRHFLIMGFADRKQADRAVAHIEQRVQPGVGLHNTMYRHVADPVFRNRLCSLVSSYPPGLGPHGICYPIRWHHGFLPT